MPVEVRASVAYMICNILQRCLSFITMPLFTRIMSTEQYGMYTVYTSWSSILMIFLTLNLAYGSFNTAMVRFEKDRTGYVSTLQCIALTLTVAFLAVYFPFQNFWNGLLDMTTPLVCLMVIEILAQFALTCWYTLKRFEFKYVGVVVVTLLISFCAPVLAYFLVMASEENKGFVRIVGYAAVNIVVGLVFFIHNIVRGKKLFNGEYWRYAFRFNISLIPYYLSQVVFNQSDRIMIDKINGTDKAALYGVAHTMAMVLTFVLNAINNSYVPWYYGKLKDGKAKDNRSVASGIGLLMAFLLMGIISLAPELIQILGGPAYAEAVWVVPPVTMSILLLYYSQLFINVEFYYEAKSMLVWGSIGSAILNIVMNGILIPRFGFVAAGYTTFASYIVFTLANYIAYRKVLKKNDIPDESFDYKALLGIFAAFCALSFTAMSLYNKPIIRYAIIAAVLLGVAVKYKAVVAFVKNTVLRKG